jgi:hypothetical protein
MTEETKDTKWTVTFNFPYSSFTVEQVPDVVVRLWTRKVEESVPFYVNRRYGHLNLTKAPAHETLVNPALLTHVDLREYTPF